MGLIILTAATIFVQTRIIIDFLHRRSVSTDLIDLSCEDVHLTEPISKNIYLHFAINLHGK